nr:hypothetical protein [Streptomyces sporangiiformans]
MTTPAAVIVDAAAYAQAVEDAVKASAAYYASGTSPLDDDAYDRLVRGIAAWEAEHPEQVLPDSPSLAVGVEEHLGVGRERRIPNEVLGGLADEVGGRLDAR